MAETPPPVASPSFKIDRAQAIIEWLGADSQLRYLYQGAQDPSRQVTFELQFDAISATAFFKIRAPVGLKAMGSAKTPLYLYIHPERITSLGYDDPELVPDIVKRELGPNPSLLQFSLTRPADMVVPSVSLIPQNRGHGEMLDSLKLLAQDTHFSVYVSHATLSKTSFQPLCDAVAARTLKHIDAAADLRGLYGGTCGKVLEGAELYIPVSKTAPPAYEELDSPPPGAHVQSDSATKPTGSSRKRRRVSASNATNNLEPAVTGTYKKLIIDLMAQYRQEDRAYFSSQLEQMRTSFSEDLRQLKSELSEHVDQRLSDLESRLCSIDDVDERVSQHVSSFEDLIEVKIEDHVTGIKMELEEFVDSEVGNVEDRVMQRVRDASWTVSIDE